MSYINSPNMNLPIPEVGGEAGPQYATDVNNSLTIVDQHTHAPGSGVQITPNGLNINSALTFNSHFATNLAGLTLIAQLSTPANSTIYQSGVDLYFVDGLGNNIQITQAGAVAGTPGSIANLASPASATYVSASKTFVWQSNTNIAANLDAASILLRNISPNSTNAVTLNPPSALGSNYSLTLPTLPASQKIMTLDNSGNMAAPYVVDNSTIVINANTLTVGTIQTANIADSSVTPAKLSAFNYALSASSGNFSVTPSATPTMITNMSVTLTASGVRPVRITVQPDGTSNSSSMNAINTGVNIYIYKDGSSIGQYAISSFNNAAAAQPPGAISIIDPSPTAGSHTYELFYQSVSGGTFVFGFAKLLAYEM